MRGISILCFTVFVAFATASPVTLENKGEPTKPLVVDVPANIEPLEAVNEEKKEKVEETKVEDKTQVNENQKPTEAVVTPDERPSIFGKFPSIVIIRRPIFDDPFSGFQSPFFTGFNRRPLYPRPVFPMDSIELEKPQEREPLNGQDSKIVDEKIAQRPPTQETQMVKNVFSTMNQHINNLFASLFNPNPNGFVMQRPTFSRPIFSRPSFFDPIPFESAEDNEDEKVDFSKLPDNYTNSTSETKVIDGQLVTVNKTVHKISGNNSNGFFHFSVIKVGPNVPIKSDTDSEKSSDTTTGTNNVKVDAAPSDNVVESKLLSEKNPAAVTELDPAMNEVDRVDAEQAKLPEMELKNMYQFENGEALPTDAESSVPNEGEIMIVPIGRPEKLIKAPSDLSSDIRINSLMQSGQGSRLRAIVNPDDIEIFDV